MRLRLTRSVCMALGKTRYRGSLSLVGAVAFGIWPWNAGCGATTHSGAADAGSSGHTAGSSAAGARAAGGSSGSTGVAAGGYVAAGGRSSAGASSLGNGGSVAGSVGTAGAGAISGNASGGTSSEAGAGGSGGEAAISCSGALRAFPEFGRACNSVADCVLVAHTTSCCGALLVMAIASSEQAEFARDEAICDAQYPLCGCAANTVDVEDGTRVLWPWQTEVRAACDGGACRAHYAGATFPCGEHACTDEQYCATSSGGPAGTEPSTNCIQTVCTECSCLSLDAACSCSMSDGHLFVTCRRA